MASNSSKALPYIGLALTALITVGTLLGYGDQIDKGIAALQAIGPYVFPSTFAVTVGGLVNKAIETRKKLIEAGSLEQVRDIVKEELANKS